MNRLLMALTLAAVLLTAAPAGAQVVVEGTGEPAFTNSSQNTQWFHYQGSSAYEAYSMRFDFQADSVAHSSVTVPLGSPNASGTTWVNWSGVTTLLEGHTYGICGVGLYRLSGINFPEPSSCATAVGKRTATTIDRTKPSITVSIDNGAAYSRDGQLDYAISYTDNLAPPFPANFLCRDTGTDPAQACAGGLTYDAGCSVPNNGQNKVNSFSCSDDLGAAADGPATLCVVSADSAIPDNPSSSNQAATAAQANRSDRVCDSITLDRTAPALSIAASATTITTGTLVSFGAEASDATSGLSGGYAWTWGDSTAAGSGANASHTFTTPGTYEVRLTTADAAGNEATATKLVTVTAPAGSGGGGTSGGGTSGGGTGGGGTGGGETGGGGTGTGGDTTAATLDVGAPKRLTLPLRRRTLSLALTASGPGRASFALVRSGRIHARGSVSVSAAGTRAYRLKLPRKLKAGKYALKVSWIPNGTTLARTRTLRLVAVAKRTRRARASQVRAALVSPVGAPVGLPDGRPLR